VKIEAGTTLPEYETVKALQCQGCEKIFDESESGGRLYECNECGNFRQDETDNQNHQCPNCHKFGHKVSEHTCPDGCSDEVEEIEAIVDPEGGELLADEDALAEAIEERKPEVVTKREQERAQKARENEEFQRRWEAADKAKWERRNRMLETTARLRDIIPKGLSTKKGGFISSIHDVIRENRDASDYGETFSGWQWEEIYYLSCIALGEEPDQSLLKEEEG
jgi:transposase